MLDILLWVSIFSGGAMFILLLLSLLGGLDLDIDVESSEADSDGGGLGYIKGGLTFISMSAWVIRILLLANQTKTISIAGGIIVGLIAVIILSKLLNFLISKQEYNEWSLHDAIYEEASVYLKIPAKGEGIIKVIINGSMKEVKARTSDREDIPTGDRVRIVDVEETVAIVTREL